MVEANTIVRDRQLAMRREMDRRGISLKAASLDSGIPYNTIVSYFPGERDRLPATISGAALFMLVQSKALPLDILSLLLPEYFQIVEVSQGVDHDEIERAARDYLATKGAAHHPNSPAGREIAPCENERLNSAASYLRAVA